MAQVANIPARVKAINIRSWMVVFLLENETELMVMNKNLNLNLHKHPKTV